MKNISFIFKRFFIFVITFSLIGFPQTASAAGTCGTGTWTPGNLEIHHINIGQGDSTLIVGPTGKSLLFDVGESYWNSSIDAQTIGNYIYGVLGCKSLDYVVISHFHVDHIGYVGYGGLWHLVETQGFSVGTTLVRNYSTYLGDISGTFTNWKTYLEGAGQAKLHPITAVEGTNQVDLGPGVTFDIVTVDGNHAITAGDFHGDTNPPSENDYSIGAVIRYGNFDEWIGGDLDGQYQVGGFGYTYHDIELSVAPEVGDVDIYKVNHHGSSHSSSSTFINQIDPEVSIVSVGDSNTYGHPTQAVMDRLLSTSTVYMTERGDITTNIGSAIVAGNVVIKTSNGSAYTVNGTSFTATEPSRTDTDGDGYFLEADPDDSEAAVLPSPVGGCDPMYQTCSASVLSCKVTAGEVFINEVLPAPSNNGIEWVELYNRTSSSIDIGYCYIDDSVSGSSPYQVPPSTMIPAHGFWTLDRNSYFNNTGDDVRFLKEDASTIIDFYHHGSTGYDVSWYRLPDGGTWAASPTPSTTKGQSNTMPFYPIVVSNVLANENPTGTGSVSFVVTFSKAVTGVNTSAPFSDFSLGASNMVGASITSVSGSGTSYIVTVNTGFVTVGVQSGKIHLNIVDDDSIRDASNHPLGGAGAGNGIFTSGGTYTIYKVAHVDISTAGLTQGDYFVPGSSSLRTSYSGLNNGPAKISSSDNTAIIASQRVAYTPDGGNTWTSFHDMMGLPSNQLAGTYYFPWYNNVEMNTQLRFGNVGTSFTQVRVTVGGVVQGMYDLYPDQSMRVSYAGLNNGPVIVQSTTSMPIIASMRFAYIQSLDPLVVPGFSELMGLPGNQLTTAYVFPWYNNVEMNTQLRFGNVGSSPTTVTVTVGGVVQGSYFLYPGQSVRVSYPNLNNGPVKVESSGYVPIIASMRFVYIQSTDPLVVPYFSEMLGLPQRNLSTTYWFPIYDNVTHNMQLRFGNMGASNTIVTVTIGGAPQGTYDLAPNQAIRVSYAGLNAGPIQVQSSGNVPIIASMRFVWIQSVDPLLVTAFSEMLGLPKERLYRSYIFPWYNNVELDTQIRFAVP